MGIKKVKRLVNGKVRTVFVFDAYIEGRRRRTPRGKYFLTRDDCEAAINALKTDALRREFGLAPKNKPALRVSKLGKVWVESLKANNRSPSYTRRAERVMECLALVTNDKPVVELTTADLQTYAQYELSHGGRTGQGKSESTVRELLTMVRVGLNAAGELFPDLSHWRPPRKPKLGLGANWRDRVITEEEEKRIIAAYLTPRKRENPYYKITREQGARIFWFALRTALRVGEIIGLRRQNVSLSASPKFPHGFIYVTEQRNSGRTKTGKARKVPLLPSVAEMLKEQLASHASEYVFPSPIDPSKPIGQFYTGFRAACKQANIPQGRETPGGITFHDTRHTAITRLLENGHPLHAVAAISGHSNTQMTMRYAHVSDDSKLRAIMSLDGAGFGVHEQSENSDSGVKPDEEG